MNPNSKPTIRKITTKEEYDKTFFPFATLAKWYPSTADTELYLSQGKSQHFYVGYINEKPFCIFLFVDYPDKNLLFFGLYYTIEEYRGKGLTLPLFNEVYSSLKQMGRKLIFTATDAMLDHYIKLLGVKAFGRINAMKIEKSKFPHKVSSSIFIKDGRKVNVNQLIAFDYKAAGYDRSITVKKFVEMPELIPIVYEDSQGIRGYCVIKKIEGFFRLSPLLADLSEIAKELLTKAFTFLNDSDIILLEVPDLENHHNNFDFIKSLGFETFYGSTIAGEVPHPNNWDLTYGCYSADIGL